jgi:hemoglobin
MDPISAPYEHKLDPALTGAVIRRLVEAFYVKARQDASLGPVFNALVEDWDAHIEKVSAFWLYATRLDRSYDARDFMPAHIRHPQVQASLLPQWLLLFRQTAREICSEEVANILIDIAERMATSIEISLARRIPPSGAA